MVSAAGGKGDKHGKGVILLRSTANKKRVDGLIPFGPELGELGKLSELDHAEKLRHDTIARVLPHLPDIIDALVKRAMEGSVSAARLVLEVAGLVRRPAATAAVQINISRSELEDLRRSLEEDGGFEFYAEA